MAYRGLFIGIDRYRSNRINWLACARRDATALHALFEDNLGTGGALLVDQDATRARIKAEFETLATCAPDDVVVIGFSGHGSESHDLVTYDADPTALSTSAIPLEELAQWFARIPAKRMIFVLDCCFSGGMGAKALRVDALPRDLPSVETFLDKLGGQGRLILTATLPNQLAWENQRTGHGLLTFHFLEGLEGPEEVVDTGHIGIYRLLEFVTKRVIASASAIGKEQHPSLRGTIDGDFSWPVFRRGAVYDAAFPERRASVATADLSSLEAFGFPTELVAAWSAHIATLNELQIAAINEFGILRGDDLVVSAPTSSGKTMVGELAALRGVVGRRRAVFLFPLKALVNDKQKHFDNVYGGYGIKTIRATGDSTTDDLVPLMQGRYDICLMTYEKFTALVLGNPHILEQVGTIVVDEVQMIADENRGVGLEFLLTLIRMQRRHGIHPQLIALSAVIGNTNGFERWLDGRLLLRTERPVPIDEGIIRHDGSWRYISSDTGNEAVVNGFIRPLFSGKGSSQDLVKPLVKRLVSEDKQVIVFREIRGEARGCARYLAEHLELPPAQAAIDQLPNGDPSLATTILRETLNGGVAFHISDLDPAERLVVEEHFRSKPTNVRVIAATTTLAMGVNTPAESVVIAGLQHPGDPPKPYSVAEYKNMVGRAGRLGFAERGASFLVALNSSEEHRLWQRYVLGKPEDLQSRFLASDTDPRSIILRILIAMRAIPGAGQGMRGAEVLEFLESSFGVFLQKRRVAAWQWDSHGFQHALESLEAHKLVERDADGRYQVTELGRFPGEAGVEIETVVRVVAALQGVAAEQVNDPTLVALTQLTVELDDLFLPMHSKSQQEPQTWFGALRTQAVAAAVISALQRNAKDSRQVTLRAKRAGACLLWITDRSLEEIEASLTRFWGKFDGAAGQIRSVSSRTVDLLPTVARLAHLILPDLTLLDRVERLLLRLEIGIPADLVEVGRVFGTRLARADYLRLRRAGIRSLADITNASDEQLLAATDNNSTKSQMVRERAASQAVAGQAMNLEVEVLPPYIG